MATDPTGATILLGPRSWGKRAGTAGGILHTTEYPSASEAHARQCILDQSKRTAAGGWVQPGSYNWIVHEAGAFLAVPYLEGSGGMAVGVAPAWQPGRYPWLRSLLGEAAYSNPTMHHVQLAFSGRAVDLLHGLSIGRGWALDMVDTAARILAWVEAQPWSRDNLVLSGHMHWQTNRSDPGQALLDAVVARINQLGAPAPAPTPAPDYRALYEAELAKVTDLARKVTAERARVAARDAHIDRYPRT